MSHETISVDDGERALHPARRGEFALDQVREALRGLRFGEVRLIIQDGVVLQIERLEKQRLR